MVEPAPLETRKASRTGGSGKEESTKCKIDVPDEENGLARSGGGEERLGSRGKRKQKQKSPLKKTRLMQGGKKRRAVSRKKGWKTGGIL